MRIPPQPLAPYACKPTNARGRQHRERESASRTVFQRDRDRIIHSAAFRKLQYKTQVFIHHEGDYFRTRLTHSLEVAQITRSLCWRLGLNQDLGEAVALAHDLGHTPFGHAGEDALHACMEKDYGGFDHNDHSLRILTSLERRYAAFDGLNLTWETLEGVVKHNGPMLPLPQGKTLPINIAAFQTAMDLELARYPSAEAQVAALSDDIAYNNHDIDDGLRAGLFKIRELLDLPLIGPILQGLMQTYPDLDRTRLIHETIRDMIGRMAGDVVEETTRRLDALNPDGVDNIRRARAPVVAMSESMQAHEREIRAFLWDRMYRNFRVNRMASKARRIVTDLFHIFMQEPETLPHDWQNRMHAAEVPAAPALNTLRTPPEALARARVVCDYIAGMTDRYAVSEHKRLFDLYRQNDEYGRNGYE